MIKIGITGSNGFIGKSIKQHFEENLKLAVERIDLPVNKIQNYDFIFHCAGVNRPKNETSFDLNRVITENLVSNVSDNSHVIYMSSIQVNKDNKYGLSKLDAETEIKKLKKWSILRLTNIFGAGCKPNYNSVVATFCQLTVNKKEHILENPNQILHLLWIKDLITFLEGIITNNPKSNIYEFINKSHSCSVTNLSLEIKKIYDDINNGFVSSIENSFRWKLETTLLSYFPSPPIRQLNPIRDKRGEFCELINSKTGQISVLKCDPGEERGLHFHCAKYERFFIIQGKGLFRSKDLSGILCEFEFNSQNISEVITIPFHVHSIKNTGDSDLIVLIWANENFDPKNPDTFKRQI